MSLSRPVNFPLLKLPWLCVKCVIQNSDMFDIIYFATICNRTRRIVKSSNYPLRKIDVIPSSICRRIFIGKKKYWDFTHYKYEFGVPLVLKRNSEPFFTNSSFDGHSLRSYTGGDELDALKMGKDFMIDVFGCTVKQLFVDGDKLLEPFVLGISSVEELYLMGPGPDNITDLKHLLETINVKDTYCRRVAFLSDQTEDSVNLDLLCQLDVSQLTVRYARFSKEDFVSYITHWFNSENRKLEYVQLELYNPVSQEDFEIEHLNPMPFCEKRRNRCPFVQEWKEKDMSSGRDILREDGLLATFFVEPRPFFVFSPSKQCLQ